MSTPIDHLVKRYHDPDLTFRHATLVDHRGTVISFAMDQHRRIHYAALDLNAMDAERGPLDVEYWPDQPLVLPFPRELVQTGYGALDPVKMPRVKAGAWPSVAPGVEADAAEALLDVDLDPFLSTTARLTADAPFQVYSDGEHVFVFRQAVDATNAANGSVFALADGSASADIGNARRDFVKDSAGAPVPLVDRTLLVDRYLLMSGQLILTRQVRYRRSENQHRPASATDSLGAANMVGEPFFEPTQELTFIRNLTGGSFSVLQLPTQSPQVRRWQIFAYDAAGEEIDAYNIERADDGWFDTQGRQLYTSPDAQYRSAVLEPAPGECPFTRRPLIPVPRQSDLASTAVALDGTQHISLSAANLPAQVTGVTLELWVRCTSATAQMQLLNTRTAAGVDQLTIYAPAQNQILATLGPKTRPVSHLGHAFDLKAWQDRWVHLAVVWTKVAQGDRLEIYIDGVPQVAGPRILLPLVAFAPDIAELRLGGTFDGGAGFEGQIDEVRLWSRPLDQAEIKGSRHIRLIGQEPGLALYWRFDEGSGTGVRDLTANGNDGVLSQGARWVAADTPLRRNSGIQHDRFQLAGRIPDGGMSTTLYHLQEDESAPAAPAAPNKQSARVMLAMTTREENAAAGAVARVAVIDMGVDREGHLARCPTRLTLTPLAAPDTKGIDAIVDLKRRVRDLEAAIAAKAQKAWQRFPSAQHEPAGQSVAFGASGWAMVAVPDAARVDVYHQAGGTWSLHQQLKAPANQPHLGFRGARVAAWGVWLVIAAQDNQVGRSLLHVYRFVNGQWTHQGQHGFTGGCTDVALSTHGSRMAALVAAEQSAFILHWERSTTPLYVEHRPVEFAVNGYRQSASQVTVHQNWAAMASQVHRSVMVFDWAKLVSHQGMASAGFMLPHRAQGQPIGLIFQVNAGRLYVGDSGHHESGQAVGALHVYRRGAYDAWTHEQTVPGAEAGIGFGEALGRSGRGADVLVIGAPRANRGAGRVYAYSLYGNAGPALVRSYDGKPNSAFGTSVAVDNTGDDFILVGAPGDPQLGATDAEVTFIGPDPKLEADLKTAKAALAAAGTASVGAYEGLMPWVHTDANGMTVRGAVLDWAKAESAPTVVPSALGQVGLYYQDADQNLLGAHFTTLSARALFALPAGHGKVMFRARASGSHMNQATITVAPGAAPLNCVITLTEPQRGVTEIWREVPRFPVTLAAILNGQAPLPTGATATISDPLYSLKNGSILFRVGVDAQAGPLSDGASGPPTRAGVDAGWRADAPGRALRFAGKAPLTLPAAHLAALPPPDDLTFEAWVHPDPTGQAARLLHFHHDAPRIGARGYSFGLVPAPPRKALQLHTDHSGDGYAGIDCGAVVDFRKSFTIEAWTCGPMTIALAPQAGASETFALEGSGTPSFGLRNQRINSTVGGPALGWRHWALVYRSETRTCRLLVDGQASQTEATAIALPDNSRLFVGYQLDGRTSRGSIYDLRVWDRARTDDDIRRDRTLVLAGTEAGLEAVYTFETGRAVDHGRHRRHGDWTTPSHRSGPVDGPKTLKANRFVAGVKHPQGGVKWARSDASLQCGRWSHVACGFKQSYALRFDGMGYVDLGKDGGFDIGDELTIEAVVQADALGREQVILSKGQPGAGDGQTVPYCLAIDRDGRLVFSFEATEDSGYTRHVSLKSKGMLTAGTVAHVAVVRERGVSVEQQRGQKTYSFTDANGNEQQTTVDTIKHVNPEHWHDIRFYIDGVEQGRHRYGGKAPAHHHGALTMAAQGRGRHALRGTISEVRLWNIALSAERLRVMGSPKAEGLVGWWTLEDKRGAAAANSVGGDAGRIRGARWIVNPDPKARAFTVFINGEPAEMRPVDDADPLAQQSWADPQFSLGGCLDGGPRDGFSGVLEEVRLWQIARTREQVLDNMFRRVDDSRSALIAYYPFDDDSMQATATTLADKGLRGRDLILPAGDKRPETVYSTVPISHDAAQIRSPLSGIQSPFRGAGRGRVAMREYGDLQVSPEQTMLGVMKRCYAYTDRGAWSLVTGFKIGELITEWIGQAQFEPQVMGYIEGCPPVPGENLTAGQLTEAGWGWKGVEGISSVEVVESGTVNYSLSSAHETNVTGAFDLEAKTNLGGLEYWLTIAPLGFGFTKKFGEAGTDVTLKGHVEAGSAWTNDSSFGTSINRSQSLSIALGAAWEDEANIANPHLGRRLVPGNVGFAVVQSQTADLYALRMKHTRTLVTFRMLPNPDVPPDWNLVPFPINPLYTKQGTLDGKIGFKADGSVYTDPDYPQATRRSAELSYYRPREAYALKRRIEREEQRLRAFFENRDTDHGALAKEMTSNALKVLAGSVGGVMGAGAAGERVEMIAGGAGGAASTMKRFKSHSDLPEKFSKRNLVNTYVWTADGGFFAETEEKSDTRSETVSGAFDVSGNVGLGVGFNFEIFKIGIDMDLSASLGGGFKMTRTRTKDSEQSFSLSVAVDPPGDLQKYEKKNGGYVADGNNLPGKVDAYRFMTFYLDGDAANFDALYEQVVDPDWLESDAPNAVALRQARQSSRRPPCWRVFHRVTYVSRILPQGKAPTDAPDLPAKLVANNIGSNWQLIKRLEPFVKQSATNGALRLTTETVLRRELPELVPHVDEIVEYLQAYFDSLRPRPAQSPRLLVPGPGISPLRGPRRIPGL